MNYYEILKLKPTATSSEIKSSYKELVKKYHPDLYVGDKDFAEQKIKEINEAYDILSDPEKKAEYDEYLNPTPVSSAQNSTYTSCTNTTNTSYSYDEQSTNSDNIQRSFFLTELIIDRFNKLDRKTQIQIFFAGFIVVLLLLFINFLQTQYYLFNPSSNESLNSNISNSTNDFENTTIDPDFTEIDKYLYNLFEKYDQSLENSSLENNSLENNDILDN